VIPPGRPHAGSWRTQLDRRAVLLGAAVAMAIALPAAIAAEVLVDSDESAFGLPLFALVLVAFGFGGFVAARRTTRSPLSNGAVAALVAYVIIQGVGVVRRVIAEETVSPAAIVFAALLASSTGLLGAFLADRRAGTSSR
jgi:putative membrane protein (TIGR04086 family)